MSVATMNSRTQHRPAPPRPRRDPEIDRIIERGHVVSAPFRPAALTSAVTALLLWASFTPLNYSPLGWLALVPLILLVRIAQPTRYMYAAILIGGLLFWLPTLQWMRLGDPTMYVAWLALACHLATYFAIFVGLARVAVHRLSVPLVLAVPVVWTGLELARGLSGFGWYFLGHTQYRWTELIQISDLVGAYGVSFLMVLSAAALAGIVPASWLARFKLVPAPSTAEVQETRTAVPVFLSIALVGVAVAYGYVRRSQADFQPGPRVALVQSNIATEVKDDPDGWMEVHRSLMRLTGQAVLEHPDVIVWPETMYRFTLFEIADNLTDKEIARIWSHHSPAQVRDTGVEQDLGRKSEMAGAAMVIGLGVVEIDRSGGRSFNSAVFVRPNGKLAGRYDKMHRVPFGEYLPFAETMPWLARLTPYQPGFGIAAGEAPAVFETNGFRFAPIICFEDTVPHVVRRIAQAPGELGRSGKPVDVLLNLTNDGWFHGSSELDQHLITAAFRCVETRTPMARSVNTGISAIIDGDGVIRGRAVDKKTGRSKQVEAVLTQSIPLDSRSSFYVATGDWFAGCCMLLCIALAVAGTVGRWLPRRERAAA